MPHISRILRECVYGKNKKIMLRPFTRNYRPYNFLASIRPQKNRRDTRQKNYMLKLTVYTTVLLILSHFHTRTCVRCCFSCQTQLLYIYIYTCYIYIYIYIKNASPRPAHEREGEKKYNKKKH